MNKLLYCQFFKTMRIKLCWLVFIKTWHKFELSERMEPQLEKFFHKTGL